MKKILILYTSVGEGHKTMAENIGWHLAQEGYEVRSSDIATVQDGAFARQVIFVHQFINKHLQFIWGWLYRWGHFAILPFRVFIAGLNSDKTKALIDEYQPDMVITTQTTASGIIAYLKKRQLYRGLFGIAFSDYHLHRYWLYPQADFYLANIEEQKQAILQLWRGKEIVSIFVCGMTMFPKQEIDQREVRGRLGIPPDDKVVLIASGSLGTAIPAEWVQSIAQNIIKETATQFKVTVIILCGKNKHLLIKLQSLVKDAQIKILGYYKPFAELCSVADIFLTKPGGLSVAEALQWNLPMLITHWLLGQEQLNYRYLQARNLIMTGPKDVSSLKRQDIVARVVTELETGEFKKSLIVNEARLKLVQSQPPVPAVQAVKQMFHGRLTP
jgi:processive 1,2-diacylglycerol beta-glucosyltransferase